MQRKINFPIMGLGCSELSIENNDIIDHALDKGCTLFDTADCFGHGRSERALGIKLNQHKDMRKKIMVCTKVGVKLNTDFTMTINGSKAYIKQAVAESLKRLQVDYIDLLYLHRADPNVCIEESMQAMKELVDEGKVKALGLCEVSSQLIQRAHKVHPLAAVQMEYSPWSRQGETNGVIETCHQLGIKVIASSPLGRGFFTQHDQQYFNALPAKDFRRALPRFVGHLVNNLTGRKELEGIANGRACPLSQLTLAWIMHKEIIPIPSTTDIHHYDENIAAMLLRLSAFEYGEIDEAIGIAAFTGERYASTSQSGIHQQSLPITFWHEHGATISKGAKYFGLFCAMAGVGAVAYKVLQDAKAESTCRPE